MTMAIRIHETGGPEVMRLEEVTLPAPGRGEVLVRNHAIGLNFIDVYFRTGSYKAALPFTPGNEGAGEIVAVGKGVKGFKEGDRVAYAATPGSYAQERIVDQKFLVGLPKRISYETAAGMMLKGLTAQYLLRRTFRVKKGHTILVHAAAGGVGQILCQWAKALGATVIGTVGSKEKAKFAAEAGAKHTILYRTENFAERVRKITKGALCDVVYDGIGKATFPDFARLSAAARDVRLLRLGLGADRRFRHRPSQSERLAVCDTADALPLYRRARGSRRDGARPLQSRRERRCDDPDPRPFPARRGERSAPDAGEPRDDRIDDPAALNGPRHRS